jgi:hypothetical protein
MTDKHTIDQDATTVAQRLPMHLPGDPQESCPLCAFLRILAKNAKHPMDWAGRLL